jgi:hypothetical protein
LEIGCEALPHPKTLDRKIVMSKKTVLILTLRVPRSNSLTTSWYIKVKK